MYILIERAAIKFVII